MPIKETNKKPEFSASGKALCLWEAAGREDLPLFCGCSNDFMLIIWSPSSTLCSASNCSLWYTETHSEVRDKMKSRALWPSRGFKRTCCAMVPFSVVWCLPKRNQESLASFCGLIWENSAKEAKRKTYSHPATGLTPRHLAILYEKEPDQVETDTKTGPMMEGK